MNPGTIDIDILRTSRFECSSDSLNQRWRQAKAAALQASVPALFQAVNILTSVLGITFPEPGYTCVQFAACPGELLWMSGELTLPEGRISLSYRSEPLENRITVSAPTGTHIKPVLKCSPADKLFVDGEPIHPDSIQLRSNSSAELAVLPGSTYVFRIVHGA